MDSADIYALATETMMAVLIGAAPVLAIALAVGLVIAFVQALTQIQEMTLTFVPKIVAIFGATIVFLPFMFATLEKLSTLVFDLIVAGI